MAEVTMAPANRQITTSDLPMPLICPISIFVMMLSPLLRLRGQLAQAFHQFFYCKSGCADAGSKIADQLCKLPLPLRVFSFQFVLRYKGAGTLLSLDQPADSEHSLGAHQG